MYGMLNAEIALRFRSWAKTRFGPVRTATAAPPPTNVSSRTRCSFVETRLIIFVLRKWINIEGGLKMASRGVNGWVGVFIVKCGKLDCFPVQDSWSVLLVCVTVVQSVKWLGCRLDTEELGFYFQQGKDISLFCERSTPNPDMKQPPIRNYNGDSPSDKMPDGEADLLLSSARIKNAWRCTYTPSYNLSQGR